MQAEVLDIPATNAATGSPAADPPEVEPIDVSAGPARAEEIEDGAALPSEEDLESVELGEAPELDTDGDPAAAGAAAAGELRDSPAAGERSSRALVPLDALSRYLAEARRYPPLEREEEVRLARAYRATGDRAAAARLVTANLILVVKIARLFHRAVNNTLDLIQEGNLGLIQALERYDPEVGVRFSTYAAWWIKAYILKYLLDNVRMVRVGTTNARRKLLYNLEREKRKLIASGLTPGPRLLAERFGVKERDVVEIEQSLSGGDVSLDAPVGEDSSETRGDFIAARAPSVEEDVAARELRDLLEEKLERFRATLEPRDRVMLDTRILADEPATLQEIGDRYGITREAVRQSEKRLKDRLRAFLEGELGKEAVLQFRSRR